MIQSVEQEGSWVLPQFSWVLPQVLIVLEHVKISSMGYASVVCLVGKRSTFSKYTQSALMHRPCFTTNNFKWLSVGFEKQPKFYVACRKAYCVVGVEFFPYERCK